MTSRIQKTISNARVNVLFYVLTAFLAFFSRKIFLDNLGTEFIGLSGTLGDILNMMNITELGIGTAVGVTLYKPIFDNNRLVIEDIISVFGYLYSKVGKLIAAVGILISLFFPILFIDTDISLGIVYLLFYALLYSSLIGYFINYRQIILSANQQQYVITWRYNLAMLVKVIAQIGVSYLPYNYIWWILLEVAMTTVYSIILTRTINREFPWLKTSRAVGKAKFKEYKHVWVKAKQVFVFKVSYLISTSTINIFIGSFASLTAVALYGNYNLLMNKITSFFDGIFTGMDASVGNLVAEGNITKILKVFFELLSIRFFIATLCSITLFFSVPRIITVWLGSEYIMPISVLVLISLFLFLQEIRITLDAFKGAYGIYNDVWAAIAEIILCVLGAFILGYLYKLQGILFAYLMSGVLMKLIWKPYYLFKEGFRCSALKLFFPKMLLYVVDVAVVFIGVYIFNSYIDRYLEIDTWTNVIVCCLTVGLITLILSSILYWVSDRNFRGIIYHLLRYRLNKNNHD